jgi:Tol biopolymer transport system component
MPKITFIDSFKQHLYVINADGSGLLRLATKFVRAPGASWSPDGERLVFSDGDLFVIDVESSKSKLLYHSPDEVATYPAWSPDGSLIAFQVMRQIDSTTFEHDISVIGTDGSGATKLTDEPAARHQEHVWSPDGSSIAFTSDREGARGLYVMNTDGGGLTRLTKDLEVAQPRWSPDGSRIAFQGTSLKSDIYVVRDDGSGLVNLTDHASADFGPTWSPDSSRIAFYSQRRKTETSQPDILVVGVDGSGLTPLTGNLSEHDKVKWSINRDPAWSPDGSRIAFVSQREDTAGLFVMKPDGDELTDLTDSCLNPLGPVWSPNGQAEKP